MHCTRVVALLTVFLLGVLARKDGDHSSKPSDLTSTEPQERGVKSTQFPEQTANSAIVQRITTGSFNFTDTKGLGPNVADTAKASTNYVDLSPSSTRFDATNTGSSIKEGKPKYGSIGAMTIAGSRSGPIESFVTTTTVNPTRTKISSCIYGCEVITLATKMGETNAVIVTALPTTLPCSLLTCPPCGCISKTIQVPGDPIVTTITPPASQVFVTAPFTITYITVTTTVTSCTATNYLEPAVVTVLSTSTTTSTRSYSYTTLTRYSTVRITATPSLMNINHPLGPNKAHHFGPDYAESADTPSATIGRSSQGWGYGKSGEFPRKVEVAGNELARNRVYGWGFKADHSEVLGSTNPETHTKVELSNHGPGTLMGSSQSITVTTKTVTVERPSAITSSNVGTLCTTYVVCNPLQFSCPNQVKAPKEIQNFIQKLQSMESDRSNSTLAGIILQDLPPPRATASHAMSSDIKKVQDSSASAIQGDEKSHLYGPIGISGFAPSETVQGANQGDIIQIRPLIDVPEAATDSLTRERDAERAEDNDSKDTTDHGGAKIQGTVSKNSGASLRGLSAFGTICIILSSLLICLLR